MHLHRAQQSRGISGSAALCDVLQNRLRLQQMSWKWGVLWGCDSIKTRGETEKIPPHPRQAVKVDIFLLQHKEALHHVV